MDREAEERKEVGKAPLSKPPDVINDPIRDLHCRASTERSSHYFAVI